MMDFLPSPSRPGHLLRPHPLAVLAPAQFCTLTNLGKSSAGCLHITVHFPAAHIPAAPPAILEKSRHIFRRIAQKQTDLMGKAPSRSQPAQQFFQTEIHTALWITQQRQQGHRLRTTQLPLQHPATVFLTWDAIPTPAPPRTTAGAANTAIPAAIPPPISPPAAANPLVIPAALNPTTEPPRYNPANPIPAPTPTPTAPTSASPIGESFIFLDL